MVSIRNGLITFWASRLVLWILSPSSMQRKWNWHWFGQLIVAISQTSLSSGWNADPSWNQLQQHMHRFDLSVIFMIFLSLSIVFILTFALYPCLVKNSLTLKPLPSSCCYCWSYWSFFIFLTLLAMQHKAQQNPQQKQQQQYTPHATPINLVQIMMIE